MDTRVHEWTPEDKEFTRTPHQSPHHSSRIVPEATREGGAFPPSPSTQMNAAPTSLDVAGIRAALTCCWRAIGPRPELLTSGVSPQRLRLFRVPPLGGDFRAASQGLPSHHGWSLARGEVLEGDPRLRKQKRREQEDDNAKGPQCHRSVWALSGSGGAARAERGGALKSLCRNEYGVFGRDSSWPRRRPSMLTMRSTLCWR